MRSSGRWLHRVAGRVEDDDDRSYQEPRLAHLDDGLNPWGAGEVLYLDPDGPLAYHVRPQSC